MTGKEANFPEGMPPQLQRYYQSNDVNVFVFSKPFRKNPAKSDNEFKDLWVKNTYYITEDSFPTIHRRSKISQKLVVEVTPIENALRTISDKNRELTLLLSKFSENKASVQEVTMVLKGVVDTPVNGGPDKYKEAFFTEEFTRMHPDKKPVLDSFRLAFGKQLKILKEGMEMYRQKCPSKDMESMRQFMEQKYKEMIEKAAGIATSV